MVAPQENVQVYRPPDTGYTSRTPSVTVLPRRKPQRSWEIPSVPGIHAVIAAAPILAAEVAGS
jgi:hypothetical protein